MLCTSVKAFSALFLNSYYEHVILESSASVLTVGREFQAVIVYFQVPHSSITAKQDVTFLDVSAVTELLAMSYSVQVLHFW